MTHKRAVAAVNRSRLRRRAIFGLHLALFTLSAVSAFVLRFEFDLRHEQQRQLLYALAVWLVTKSGAFHCFRLDRTAWRFWSPRDAVMLFAANVLGSVAAVPVIATWGAVGFPRSVYVLDCAICLLLTGGAHVAARVLLEGTVAKPGAKPRAFIYGAGAGGARLLRASRLSPGIGYTIAGFIDDEPSKRGMLIDGVPVRGAGDALGSLASKWGVSTVLIAAPSATKQQMLNMLKNCAAAKLRFLIMPGLSELVPARDSRVQIRDVALEDLLGRVPVRLDEANVRAKIEGQVIMVTGAAGSIGSELCRQLARFGPKTIVAFDLAETGLFHIDREMRRRFPGISFVPVVGSIQNATALATVLKEHRPAALYHAAAYKHVPLMEQNLFEAIENNILGTFRLAVSAESAGVREFVMISSDKAVRPTNIMGLTKRVAEILLSSLQNGGAKYISVRFGNVLGTNGSAVPIFREQIAAGGPVTVTHPEMRRYFMTIPEAVELVLQAYTMGQGGEIFVLDMGEPVKIVDLARNLILLSGLHPDEDIRIEFTGIRPGEKLYEELTTSDEETRPTYHEKIRIFSGNGPRIADLGAWIETVRQRCASRDTRIILDLKELVPEYNPSADVIRCIYRHQHTSESANAALAASGY